MSGVLWVVNLRRNGLDSFPKRSTLPVRCVGIGGDSVVFVDGFDVTLWGPMVEIAGSYVLALKRFIAFIWSGLVS